MTGIGCLTMAKNPVGKIEFEKTSFHFGTFEKRIVRTCVFVFKNTGSAPVVINQVNTTCNCTSVRFAQTPILPNKKGYITVVYDASITTRGILEKASTFGRMQRMVWCDCLSLVQQSKRYY